MSAVVFHGRGSGKSAQAAGVMARWGGKPYWDGQFWRCPDCNGLINSTGTCSTCLRVPDRTNGRNSWSGRERR